MTPAGLTGNGANDRMTIDVERITALAQVLTCHCGLQDCDTGCPTPFGWCGIVCEARLVNGRDDAVAGVRLQWENAGMTTRGEQFAEQVTWLAVSVREVGRSRCTLDVDGPDAIATITHRCSPRRAAMKIPEPS